MQLRGIGKSLERQGLADFGQGSESGLGFVDFVEGIRVAAFQDGFFEWCINCDEFGQGESAAVSIAVFSADQALGDDAVKAAGELIRFDAHFQETGDRSSRRRGVQGGNESMPR
jgi:hypothetical protein